MRKNLTSLRKAQMGESRDFHWPLRIALRPVGSVLGICLMKKRLLSVITSFLAQDRSFHYLLLGAKDVAKQRH